MPSLEDLDRRVSALERAAQRDRSIERATAEIVAEAEKRLTDRVIASERRMVEGEKRLTDRVVASERRMVDTLNERFDAVMVALDRLTGSS